MGLDRLIEARKSFNVATILIDITIWQFINEWMHMSINGKRYDIYVKELGVEVYGAMCFPNILQDHHSASDLECSSLRSSRKYSHWNQNIPFG